MKVAILNANLAPGGKPAHLADTLASFFAEAGHEALPIPLFDRALPLCDGYHCYRDERTIALTAELAEAEALVLVAPVYNYDLNAAAKNLVELTGVSWKGKAVGLVCTAGGEKSYLSPLGFLNSLALDHRCLVSPRYVYVERSDFADDGTLPADGDILARLRFLVSELPILARAAAEIGGLRG